MAVPTGGAFAHPEQDKDLYGTLGKTTEVDDQGEHIHARQVGPAQKGARPLPQGSEI